MVETRQSTSLVAGIPVLVANRLLPFAFLLWMGFGTCFAQSPDAGHRIIRTYGGDLVIRFPNYDLHVRGPASRDFGFNPTRSNGAPLVFRNNEGMFWDGSAGFISPNYPYHLITKNRYTLRSIDEPNVEPPSEPSGLPPATAVTSTGSIHIPVIPYRPPSDGDVVLKMAERKMTGMLRMSRLDNEPKIGLKADERTDRSIKRPTATIIVRPLTRETRPPAHDSLGLYLQR